MYVPITNPKNVNHRGPYLSTSLPAIGPTSDGTISGRNIRPAPTESKLKISMTRRGKTASNADIMIDSIAVLKKAVRNLGDLKSKIFGEFESRSLNVFVSHIRTSCTKFWRATCG